MDFYELAERRQSCRAYSPQAIDPAVLRRIADVARLAPSACNSQPWHIINVTQPEIRDEVADALTSMGMNRWVDKVPAFMVIVQESPNFTARLGGWIKNKHFPLIDCGILASYISLAATQEQLGSCILGWFDEKRLKKILQIPRSKRVLMVVAIGHGLDEQRAHQRKSFDEIVSNDKYNSKWEIL